MGSKKWGTLALWMPLLLAGCKGFWNPVGSSDFSLSNSGTISVSSPGATSGNTSTITVTPSSSFSGTVALTCAVTTSPSGATSPVTCSLSPTSVAISGSTAETATLTASTTSTTTTGTYEITVTGTSGSATTTTTACVTVGTSSGNCSTASATTSGNFYVLNAATDQITGLYVNNGVLTALTGGTATPADSPSLHRHRAERRISSTWGPDGDLPSTRSRLVANSPWRIPSLSPLIRQSACRLARTTAGSLMLLPERTLRPCGAHRLHLPASIPRPR